MADSTPMEDELPLIYCPTELERVAHGEDDGDGTGHGVSFLMGPSAGYKYHLRKNRRKAAGVDDFKSAKFPFTRGIT